MNREPIFSVEPRVWAFWVGKGATSGLYYVMHKNAILSEHKTEDAAMDAREMAELDHSESKKWWM